MLKSKHACLRGPFRRAEAQRAGVLAALGMSVALAGCGGTSQSATSQRHSTSVPKSGLIDVFTFARSNPYTNALANGATSEAKTFGWTTRVFQTDLSQEQQDNQIREVLAGGQKPLGIELHPFNGPSAAASEAAIKAAHIPLVIVNQTPAASTGNLFDAYAGTYDVLSGQTAARLLEKAAAAAHIKLSGGIAIMFPAGYAADADRLKGFEQYLPRGARVIDVANSTGFLAPNGYAVAAQLIPAKKGQFNWIYTGNDAQALGAIKALQQNGLTPGKDVLVVGGTCDGIESLGYVRNGELVGTGVQSPTVEGALGVLTLHELLADGGKVLPGSVFLPASGPPSPDAVPHKYNWMPNFGATKADLATSSTWGIPNTTLCSFATPSGSSALANLTLR